MTEIPPERPVFRTWKATIGGVPHTTDEHGKPHPVNPKEDDK